MTTIAVNAIHAGDPRNAAIGIRMGDITYQSNQGLPYGRNLTLKDLNVDQSFGLTQDGVAGLTVGQDSVAGLTTGQLQITDPSRFTGGRIGIGDGVYIGDYPPLITDDRTAPYRPGLPWIIEPSFSPPQSNSYIMMTPPAWRVSNRLDRLEISTDLPGVKPKDLDVALEGRLMKVTARRADTGESISRSQYVMETFLLESAEAILEEGVLTVTFKPEPKKSPRTIPVVVKR